MEIELKHCDLEINYIGTPFYIALQESSDIVEKLAINIANVLTGAINHITENYDNFIKSYNE